MARALPQLLRELGASSASQVTITELENTRGANLDAASASADQRSAARERGDAVASYGGGTTTATPEEVTVLVAAGAQDLR
jgi:hypothetical protein